MLCVYVFFQVIYRALSPWGILDPYSSEAHAQIGITNLRVRLLQPQPCPCQHKESNTSLISVPYAISDFILKGACLCHGHADQCVTASDYLATHKHGHHVVSWDPTGGFYILYGYLYLSLYKTKILNTKVSHLASHGIRQLLFRKLSLKKNVALTWF